MGYFFWKSAQHRGGDPLYRFWRSPTWYTAKVKAAINVCTPDRDGYIFICKMLFGIQLYPCFSPTPPAAAWSIPTQSSRTKAEQHIKDKKSSVRCSVCILYSTGALGQKNVIPHMSVRESFAIVPLSSLNFLGWNCLKDMCANKVILYSVPLFAYTQDTTLVSQNRAIFTVAFPVTICVKFSFC